MTWRAANSLLILHEQLQHGAPAAAPPATDVKAWGLKGDALHDPTSDHTPHDFPGWGTEIVTAADFPNKPTLGLDAHRVLDDIRRARDPRAKYGISNKQIFSNHAVDGYGAWEWRPYDGDDPHDEHGHLSVVGDSRADGGQPWPTIGADMGGSSFGPVLMRTDDMRYPMVVPPVRGGLADPRPTWLNAWFDLGSAPVFLRIWVGDGSGAMRPLMGGGHEVVKLESCEVFSIELDAGVRGISVLRVPDPNGPKDEHGTPNGTLSDAPVSFCFERQ